MCSGAVKEAGEVKEACVARRGKDDEREIMVRDDTYQVTLVMSNEFCS
jgi:hypothetical protein